MWNIFKRFASKNMIAAETHSEGSVSDNLLSEVEFNPSPEKTINFEIETDKSLPPDFTLSSVTVYYQDSDYKVITDKTAQATTTATVSLPVKVTQHSVTHYSGDFHPDAIRNKDYENLGHNTNFTWSFIVFEFSTGNQPYIFIINNDKGIGNIAERKGWFRLSEPTPEYLAESNNIKIYIKESTPQSPSETDQNLKYVSVTLRNDDA